MVNSNKEESTLSELMTLWFTLGIDLESRRIDVDTEVDETMASIIVRSLLKMSELSKDPIELYLSTFGGDAYSAMKIYDAITACDCDVHIIASGKIMSAGFIIFLAGDQRTAAPHTAFMMHSISYESEGKVKDQEISVIEAKRLNNIFLDILAQRTNKNKKYWYRKLNGPDQYMDVAQAKECGVIPQPKVSIKKGNKKNVQSKTRK